MEDYLKPIKIINGAWRVSPSVGVLREDDSAGLCSRFRGVIPDGLDLVVLARNVVERRSRFRVLANGDGSLVIPRAFEEDY